MAAALLAAMGGCGATGAVPDEAQPEAAAAPAPPPSAQARAIAPSTIGFGLDLYRRLGEGNLFFSPVSISAGFGMVQAGARGETQAEIGRVFHYPADQAALHRGLGDLQRSLPLAAQGRQLTIANALWVQQGFALDPNFLAATLGHYGAAPTQLDFLNPEAAAARVNRWAEQNTNGRIRNLLPASAITPETRLVLTNTIWFLADWERQFRREGTHERDFFADGGAPVRARLMHQTASFRHIAQAGFQAIELPYAGGEMSMIVLLPTARGGLPALEREMSAERLAGWLQALAAAQPERVELALPRIDLATRYELPRVLEQMGLRTAFTDRADLSGMAGGRLMLSQVIHQTFLRIDEQGTEAAAATAISAAATGAAPRDPVRFIADHPFFFMIRDNRSGAALFMGRVARPAQAN